MRKTGLFHYYIKGKKFFPPKGWRGKKLRPEREKKGPGRAKKGKRGGRGGFWKGGNQLEFGLEGSWEGKGGKDPSLFQREKKGGVFGNTSGERRRLEKGGEGGNPALLKWEKYYPRVHWRRKGKTTSLFLVCGKSSPPFTWGEKKTLIPPFGGECWPADLGGGRRKTGKRGGDVPFGNKKKRGKFFPLNTSGGGGGVHRTSGRFHVPLKRGGGRLVFGQRIRRGGRLSEREKKKKQHGRGGKKKRKREEKRKG